MDGHAERRASWTTARRDCDSRRWWDSDWPFPCDAVGYVRCDGRGRRVRREGQYGRAVDVVVVVVIPPIVVVVFNLRLILSPILLIAFCTSEVVVLVIPRPPRYSPRQPIALGTARVVVVLVVVIVVIVGWRDNDHGGDGGMDAFAIVVAVVVAVLADARDDNAYDRRGHVETVLVILL